jgi:hypothetical protein
MSDLVVNESIENVPTFTEVNKILTKSSKLTSNDLIKICKYYNLTPIQLFKKLRNTFEEESKNSDSECSIDNSSSLDDEKDSINKFNEEKIIVILPQDEHDKPKTKTASQTKHKTASPKKKLEKSISFSKIKSIVGKKKINKNDLRLLSQHYKTRIKDGLDGIWFSAAEKGHLFILKKLYSNKHIKDTNITNKTGKTAQQIAEINNRGHISKWLASESTQNIIIGHDTGYHFKQTHSSDSEECDKSISND